MNRRSLENVATGIFVSTVLCVAHGCRDREPLPSQYTDLGDGTRTLLPLRAIWHSVPFSPSDTAQWVEFRDPREAVAVQNDKRPDEAVSEVGGDDRVLEAEIRALIAEYNEIALELDMDDPDVDALLEYHVESQREALAASFAARTKIVAKLAEIRDALIDKLPGAEDRINTALTLPDVESSPELTVGQITVRDSETVEVQLSGGLGRAMLVRLIDGDWYLDMPELANVQATAAGIDASLAAWDVLIEKLNDGSAPAESVLVQLETLLKSLAASLGAATEQGNVDAGTDESDSESGENDE